MIKNNNHHQIENFAGENFSSEKYYYDLVEGMPFTFNRKKERLKDVKNIIKKEEQNNEVNSSKHVDILLGNYELFINIGKYVDKIDKNITKTISAQKKYSNLLSNLRKDIEEFSFSFSKYLKTIKEEENQEGNTFLENNIKENNNGVYKFEVVDDIDIMEENFDFEDFLNPGEGSDKWLSEHIEKLKMLIDEKKYDQCIDLILLLRKKDLSKLDYSNSIILDDAYNELIEKLTLSIGKCSTIKEVEFFLEKMKILGCESLAVDTFLSWLSRKLRNRTQKKIIGEDDYDFISDEKKKENNLSLSLSRSFKKKSIKMSKSSKGKKENLNEIKEEDEENILKEEEEEENIKPEEVVDKNEIDTNEIINLINNKEHNMDQSIIMIIGDYFDNLIRSLEIMNTYFNIKIKNKIYSTYIIPWLRQEIFSMNKQLENLFGKVRTLNELSSILDFISDLFSKLDLLGESAKFIYDMHFIKNLNISLISIINYCLKVNITGVPFDLKYYNIKFDDNITLPLLCVSELSPQVYNISILIAEFIQKYSKMKKKFIGIIFLEENLFDYILNREFFPFIKNKILKNISNNYDLMPFSDNNESMAPSNQTLINYGITIISIEIFFNKIISNPQFLKELSKSTIENIQFFLFQFGEEKKNYFSNLLKVKTESHFFKYFEKQSSIFSKNINNANEISKFTGPDKAFLSFFQLLKNIAKMIKAKTKNSKEYNYYFLEYFIIESIYNNFLNVIQSLKNLNEVYETEFNLSKMGTNGLEHVIYGIYFVYFCLKIILGLDTNEKYLKKTRKFMDEFISEWSQTKNMPCDFFIQNKINYENNVQQYINNNKSQLATGYQ